VSREQSSGLITSVRFKDRWNLSQPGFVDVYPISKAYRIHIVRAVMSILCRDARIQDIDIDARVVCRLLLEPLDKCTVLKDARRHYDRSKGKTNSQDLDDFRLKGIRNLEEWYAWRAQRSSLNDTYLSGFDETSNRRTSSSTVKTKKRGPPSSIHVESKGGKRRRGSVRSHGEVEHDAIGMSGTFRY
jgi:hypothetical protein